MFKRLSFESWQDEEYYYHRKFGTKPGSGFGNRFPAFARHQPNTWSSSEVKPLNSAPAPDNNSDDLHFRHPVLWMLAATLVFAPLFRSGQVPFALLTLELLAVAILLLVLWTPHRKPITRRETTALLILFVFPLPYLFPLPAEIRELLPGREPYSAALSLLSGNAASSPAPISLYLSETESAWLLLLVPIAVFLGTRVLDHRAAFKLVLLLLGIAAFQATLGLMQFGDGNGSPLYLGMSGSSAVGTYTNGNHLAGLLEMVFPLALALFIFSLGRGQQGFARNWKGRISFYASVRGHTAFVYGTVALLLLVGVIFTRSRTGIALAMLGIVVTSFALSRRIGGDNVYGPTGTLTAIALGMGVSIGLAPVLDRFSVEDALADARVTLFSNTLDGIASFFPIGSGPGTYPYVFPAFQPAELGRWFINHAHNDYLEWLFEGGLFAALLILTLLVFYAHQWTWVWTKAAWTRFKFAQIGAGIGIFLMLLHTLADYNLHIPANLVYFAFLTAIFFADPAGKESPRHRRVRKGRTSMLADQQYTAPTAVVPSSAEPPTDQIKNPFLD